jgi:macrodomain Ter protein organizer (MatP/YcbG family)
MIDQVTEELEQKREVTTRARRKRHYRSTLEVLKADMIAAKFMLANDPRVTRLMKNMEYPLYMIGFRIIASSEK